LQDTTAGEKLSSPVTFNLITSTTFHPRLFRCCGPTRNSIPIQSDSGEKVKNLRGDSNGYFEENVHMNMCLILKGYRNRAVWISRPSSVSLIVRLDRERFTKDGGYTRRIARTHFGCCCPHTETWRSTQTNNTRTSYTICNARWD